MANRTEEGGQMSRGTSIAILSTYSNTGLVMFQAALIKKPEMLAEMLEQLFDMVPNQLADFRLYLLGALENDRVQ